MADVELTLSWLGLSQYLERFLEAGFDSWETILWITESDLEVLDVELGHRRRLQREIANSKRLAQDPAFVQPLYPSARQQSPPEHSSNLRPTRESRKKKSRRRHPKPDLNAPEQPYSAFVMFSNHTREQLKAQNLSFTNLSKQVEKQWQNLTSDEQEAWNQRGAESWEDYKTKMAEYQRTDQYREYQRYLADFKATQVAQKPSSRQSVIRESPTALRPYAPDTSTFSLTQHQPSSPSLDQGTPTQKDTKDVTRSAKKDEESWTRRRTTGVRGRPKCEPCRQQRLDCDGRQPVCRHCERDARDCRYEKRRVNVPKQVDDLWLKVKAYESLLLDFVSKVDGDDQQAIHNALNQSPKLSSPADADKLVNPDIASDAASDQCHSEFDSSGVGSMGYTDRVNEAHFNPEGGPTVFTGQASDTKWMQKLRVELNRDPAGDQKGPVGEGTANPPGVNPAIAARRFQVNTEDSNMSVVGDQIYPLELPIRSTADNLIQAYFTSIHLSFPLLNRNEFISQYIEVRKTPDLATYRDRTFIATLHLVFALGAVHAHLVDAEWAGDERDHILYIACARLLSVDSGILNDLCYLGQVRIFALGALYLLATDQINRSWNLTGLAIRSAQSMGMHLLNVTPSLTAAEKDAHARTWYTIASLESMLTIITGRPSMINARDCSVPLIRVLEDEERSLTDATSSETSQQSSSNPKESTSSRAASSQEISDQSNRSVASIYFKHYAELCMLAREVVGELYSPGIRAKKWADVQELIDRFDKLLFNWKEDLSPPFDGGSPSSNSEIESCRVALRLLFHSTRTIIHRPCLCRLDERIIGQSRSSKRRNRDFANNCVESARSVLNLIINKPDTVVLRRGATWWMILHHLKRATIVLLLEISFNAEHTSADVEELLTEAKAAVNWLHHLVPTSPIAKHAWVALGRLLSQAAQRVGGDTDDIFVAPDDPSIDVPLSNMDLSGSLPGHPSAAYDPDDPSTFPPIGFYGGSRQGDWSEFGFMRAQGGRKQSSSPQDQEVDGVEEKQGSSPQDEEMDLAEQEVGGKEKQGQPITGEVYGDGEIEGESI